MRNYIYIFLITICCSNAVASSDVVAFIGEAISATRSDKSCQEYLSKERSEDGQLQEICMDRVFEYKYEVKAHIQGAKLGKDIEFTGFYHFWGIPGFTTRKNSLVIVKDTKFGYMLQTTEWAEQVAGKWVVCEEWPESEDECTKYTPVSEYLKTFNKRL